MQEVVSRSSAERTEHYRQQGLGGQSYVAQMPRITCTLTGLRELYLKPGVNMRTIREHPQQLTHPKYPNPTKTRIVWLDGKSYIHLIYYLRYRSTI